MDEATLRTAIKKFNAVVEQYADLGVCDSEGRAALAEWFDKAARNEPTPQITYRYLDAFRNLYGADGEKIPVPLSTQTEVASAIATAAEELLPVLCKAKRAGLIKDAYDMMRWS